MREKLSKTWAVLALGLCTLAPGSGFAKTFPEKPVTIVVPFAVGGPTDTSARVVATALTGELGEKVIVENIPGAGSVVGTTHVANAKPDGYTLLWGTSSGLAIAPHIYSNVRYDPAKSFAPVSMVVTSPFILAVRPSLDVKTVAQFVALAKAHPGKLNFASTGTGGSTHLTAELFQSVAGISSVHVPYNGGAPAMNALLSKNVDYLFDTPTTIVPMAKSGRILALAVTSTQRWPALPDVPTFQELGYKNFESTTWFGLLAPAGTPADRTAVLNKAVATALRQPQVVKALEHSGFVVHPSSEQEFAARIAADGKKWEALIEAAHIHVK